MSGRVVGIFEIVVVSNFLLVDRDVFHCFFLELIGAVEVSFDDFQTFFRVEFDLGGL